jgi:radical SAM family uncharacterized protein/radical SAM-linked protein
MLANPYCMKISDQNLLLKVKRPSRYLGGEINSVVKENADIEVSIALVFPDVYEVGMSHQGLKILYHILNSQGWIAAERAYSVWIDMEKEMRSRDIVPSTLDSGRPLTDFDIIGFSLQHELCYTNVLNMLDLCRIPFLSRERDDKFPLIIAGGPACFNPEPVADIFDVVVVGDGEEATLDICRTVRYAKGNTTDKQDILDELVKIRGVYIPSFYNPHYHPAGPISYTETLKEGCGQVKKALVPDIEQFPFPSDQVVPFTRLVHDRLVIEIARGCSRGCRFCQAGMIYRPVRERNPESVIKNADYALLLTGFEDLSLLSLSAGDYGCIAPLIKTLMDILSEKKISLSLPSLRVDSLDSAWFEQIKRVRKTGFTIAPETGNDRLRKVINKSLTNRDVLNTARELYGAGWNLIKLYFMIGLPAEEQQDREDIINLAKKVCDLAERRGKKAVLNVSISTFVPKAHTPFMWATQMSLEESWTHINNIRKSLKGSRIRVKWNQPELSWLEGIFSRGDRRLISPLIEAWRLGARYDAWKEQLNMDIWKEAFERSGLDPGFYLYRTRSLDEVFPWDHITSGVTKDYLKKEWERAHEGKITPDCRDKCLECGVCDHKYVDHVLYKDWTPPQVVEKDPVDHPEAGKRRYRLIFSKTGNCRYFSHLELVRVFTRAFGRAGLKMVFSKGYHPLPKVSFASALPVGAESLYETADIGLYETIPVREIKERLNRQLPDGLRVNLVEDISLMTHGRALLESHFQVTINGIKIDETLINDFLDSDKFLVIKRSKKGERQVNLRSLVKEMTYTPPHKLHLVIEHVPGPEIRPIRIIQEILHLKDQDLQGIKILKTRQVMG